MSGSARTFHGRTIKFLSEEKTAETRLCGQAQVFGESSVDWLFLEDFEGIAAQTFKASAGGQSTKLDPVIAWS